MLIGGAFADRDRHLTPLAIATREPVYGIEIHAQILAQLRDGRSIHEMPGWAEFLVVAAMAGMGAFAAQRWRLKGDGWRTSFVAMAAMVAAGLGLFWAAHFILPSATLFLGWGAGLFAGDQMDAGGWRGRIFGGKTNTASEG